MGGFTCPRWFIGSLRARRLVLVAVVLGLLTAVSAGRATGATTTSIPLPSSNLSCLDNPCYSPQQFEVAYGIGPLLQRGIDGRGKTVTAVVPAALASDGPTDIRRDLAAFDAKFHLPAAPIEVVTSLVPSASRWQAEGEEIGDLEIIHAVAPGATLRVVLFPASWDNSPANATADMLAALALVVSDTDVASISWGLGTHYFTRGQVAKMHTILVGAQTHHVTVVASSGDDGVYPTPRGWPGRQLKEVSLPNSDPLVLSVGGTELSADPRTGAYIGETAWPDSGGGFSQVYTRPAYQDRVPGISTARGVPDVAGDADAPGGMAQLYTSGGADYLITESGTSGSTPLWGGILALADQYAHKDLGFVNPAVYDIGRGSAFHKAFHDVASGFNGYEATPGWDPVTGWGSPDAHLLVPVLVRLATGSPSPRHGR
jgi:subtilase family serine protease